MIKTHTLKRIFLETIQTDVWFSTPPTDKTINDEALSKLLSSDDGLVKRKGMTKKKKPQPNSGYGSCVSLSLS